MFSSMLNSLFGCGHQKTTFPLTPGRGGKTYVACLDCGKELDYDWKNMRVGEPVRVPVVAVQQSASSTVMYS
jgi:hypothetical protein